jgi:hypothetical protein
LLAKGKCLGCVLGCFDSETHARTLRVNGYIECKASSCRKNPVYQSHVYFKNKRGWFRFSNGELNKLTKDELDRFTKGLERDSIYQDFNE